MTYLLLDPPVNPFPTQSDILAWLRELNELARKNAGDRQPTEAITRAHDEASSWLTMPEIRRVT